MTRTELKQLIKEAIEDIQSEAAGPAYTFNQLNRLVKSGKTVVFIKTEYQAEMVAVSEDGFFMQENEDGEQTVHTSDGVNAYEYGVDFNEVYVAQKVNVK
jgi:hypothetical protein